MKKFLYINVILFTLCSLWCTNYVYADDTDIFSQADEFIQSAKSPGGDIESEDDEKENILVSFSNALVNFFMSIGTIVAVIWITFLGIRFMVGSVEEKAEVKESLMPFIIGCAVVFGAFTIWKLAVELLSKL